ncbi:hypothetical protein F2Q68_00040355 [Brassica cretica]|uniref:Uncharacterized protein n=1 Tax=Brassica cretica TaxID=69181 RepID=A0A8S9MK79_BRACR|nr:hypothetical protein F2Q68_00040355 [Brassica cretica]
MLSLSRVRDSSSCTAPKRMVPPGVSYTPPDFIPTKRFSTMLIRPIVFSPERRVAASRREKESLSR